MVTIYEVARLRVPDIVLESILYQAIFLILLNVCKIYFTKTCVSQHQGLVLIFLSSYFWAIFGPTKLLLEILVACKAKNEVGNISC